MAAVRGKGVASRVASAHAALRASIRSQSDESHSWSSLLSELPGGTKPSDSMVPTAFCQ